VSSQPVQDPTAATNVVVTLYDTTNEGPTDWTPALDSLSLVYY